jgi:hypothetical protein
MAGIEKLQNKEILEKGDKLVLTGGEEKLSNGLVVETIGKIITL